MSHTPSVLESPFEGELGEEKSATLSVLWELHSFLGEVQPCLSGPIFLIRTVTHTSQNVANTKSKVRRSSQFMSLDYCRIVVKITCSWTEWERKATRERKFNRCTIYISNLRDFFMSRINWHWHLRIRLEDFIHFCMLFFFIHVWLPDFVIIFFHKIGNTGNAIAKFTVAAALTNTNALKQPARRFSPPLGLRQRFFAFDSQTTLFHQFYSNI